MGVQARLPPALAALHNFIRIHDPGEIDDMLPSDDNDNDITNGIRANVSGELATELPRRAERDRANERRDNIAQAMWTQYQDELQRRELA